MRATRLLFSNPPDYELLVPDSTIINSWSIVGGSASAHAALADESNATSITAAAASSQLFKVGFSNPTNHHNRTVKAVDLVGIGASGASSGTGLSITPSSVTSGSNMGDGRVAAGKLSNNIQSYLAGVDGMALASTDLDSLIVQASNTVDTYNGGSYEIKKLRARVWYAAPALSLWRKVPGGPSFNLQALAYGNGVLIVSGASGFGSNSAFSSSTNGTTWTTRSGGVNNPHYKSLVFGNNTFAALSGAGANGSAYSIDDGVTWSAGSGIDKAITSACYGNGTFVAVSSGGTTTARAFSSTDGITWTARTTPTDWAWSQVAFANGVFVAIGGNDLGTQGVITSADGVSWTLTTSGITELPALLVSNGTRFVGTSTSGHVYYSTNGTAWTKVSSAFEPTGGSSRVALFHDGSRFIRIGNLSHIDSGDTGGPNIFHSTDGASWNRLPYRIFINGQIIGSNAVVCVNGRYHAAAEGIGVYVSETLR